MATCYDCIHCDACSDAGDAGYSSLKEDVTKCKHFKNKADFAEVKHGEWLLIVNRSDYLEPPSCDTAKCSVCQKKIDVSETGFKYCPHCGAKMDGGRTSEQE
jgi:hypothetical protein